MARMLVAADASLAAIRARMKLGRAIAAMTRMMATTMRSSTREKPRCALPMARFCRECCELIAGLLSRATRKKGGGNRCGLLPLESEKTYCKDGLEFVGAAPAAL